MTNRLWNYFPTGGHLFTPTSPWTPAYTINAHVKFAAADYDLLQKVSLCNEIQNMVLPKP